MANNHPIAEISRYVLNAIMPDYYKRMGKRFAMIAAVPAFLGFVSSWSAGLGFLLFLFVLPAAALIVVAYAVVSFARGIRLARGVEAPWRKAALIGAAPVILVCTLALAWPFLAAGSFVGSLSRLLVNRGNYEAIIKKVQVDPKPVWFEEDRGTTYSVDIGPPVRLAFNPAGMLDNWSGIIYDPTGEVMLAQGFDRKSGHFFAPDRITKLFNGDLVGCRHLWGDYYDCSFT